MNHLLIAGVRYHQDHTKIVVKDPRQDGCEVLCNYMQQRNSVFARYNQIARVKLTEKSPRATLWETWNLEADCGSVAGATFDGVHHSW